MKLRKAVPIDHKDETRAQEFEEAIDAGHAFNLSPPLYEQELAGGAEADRCLLDGLGPLDVLIGQKIHKESGPGAMHIGVGDGDGEAFDMNDDNMRIGGANIVLDEKDCPAASRRCAKAWMRKGQMAGSIKPPHKGFDARLVLSPERMDRGSRCRLHRGFSGKTIDGPA